MLPLFLVPPNSVSFFFFDTFLIIHNKYIVKKKTATDKPIGHECPFPEGYTFDDTAPWCTLTSSTENQASAAAVIYHAVDSPMFEKEERK
jgi:hypothetical protein